jgi:hypothetical protein
MQQSNNRVGGMLEVGPGPRRQFPCGLRLGTEGMLQGTKDF